MADASQEMAWLGLIHGSLPASLTPPCSHPLLLMSGCQLAICGMAAMTARSSPKVHLWLLPQEAVFRREMRVTQTWLTYADLLTFIERVLD